MRMALAIPSAIGNEVFVTYIGIGLPAGHALSGQSDSDRTVEADDRSGVSALPAVSSPWRCWSVITISFYIIGNAFADAADPKNHVR